MQAGGHNGIKAADAMVEFHFECEVQYGMDVRLWFGCGGGRIYKRVKSCMIRLSKSSMSIF